MARPRIERPAQEDLNYIKSQCKKAAGNLSNSYREICAEAQKGYYKAYEQPDDVETVKSAFQKFFNGSRSLPEIYWLVIEELYGIKDFDLPSKQTSESDGQPSSGDAGTARIDRNVPLVAQFAWLRSAPLPEIKRKLIAYGLDFESKQDSAKLDNFNSDCALVIAERLSTSTIDDVVAYFKDDHAHIPYVSRVHDTTFNIILFDSGLKSAFYGGIKKWLSTCDDGKVISRISDFFCSCCRFFPQNKYGDIDEWLGDTIAEIPQAILAQETTSISDLLILVIRLKLSTQHGLWYYFTNSIGSLFFICTRSHNQVGNKLVKIKFHKNDQLLIHVAAFVAEIEKGGMGYCDIKDDWLAMKKFLDENTFGNGVS